MLSFFFDIILFLIFASFLELNLKNQTTIDEHRHKVLVTLVFFMVMYQVEKIKTPAIHKQAWKLNKWRRKWKDEMKKKLEDTRSDLRFTFILQ